MKFLNALLLSLALLAAAPTAPAAVMSTYPLVPYIEPPDLLLVTHYPFGNTNNPQTYNLQATNLGLSANFAVDTNLLTLYWAGNTQLGVASNEFGNTWSYAGPLGGSSFYSSQAPGGYSARIYISNNFTAMMVIKGDYINNTLNQYALTSPDLHNWYYASNSGPSWAAADNSLVATSPGWHQLFTGCTLAAPVPGSQVTGPLISAGATGFQVTNQNMKTFFSFNTNSLIGLIAPFVTVTNQDGTASGNGGFQIFPQNSIYGWSFIAAAAHTFQFYDVAAGTTPFLITQGITPVFTLTAAGAADSGTITASNLVTAAALTLGRTNSTPAGYVVGTTAPILWFPVTNNGAVYMVPGYHP